MVVELVMETLPILETPYKRRLNSRNCTTPIGRQISYHEVIRFGRETLHRSLSFQQLWSSDHKGVEKAITQIAVINCQVLNQLPPHANKRKKLTVHDSTPKKFGLIREPRIKFSKFLRKMFITIAIVTTLAGVAYKSLSCYETKLMYERQNFKPVVGQDQAISKIMDVLMTASSFQEERPSLLILAGPTGVGKTFTSSIISSYFPSKENIHIFSANELSYYNLQISVGRCMSLILVEGCDCQNIDNVLNELKRYGDYRRRRLLVVLSFTRRPSERWCNIDKDAGLFHKHIVEFSPLKAEDVRICIMNEIVRQRAYRTMKISSEELTKLVEQQMKVIPEGGSLPGCKLVQEKVIQFLAEKSTEEFKYV